MTIKDGGVAETPESLTERALTAAMREADRAFETVGGSTRHFVRDCLLPALEKHGLEVRRKQPLDPDSEALRRRPDQEAK